MLGIREPAIYGRDTLASIEAAVVAHGVERDAKVICFQSNHEGDLIDRIHAAHGVFDGIVFKSRCSYALLLRHSRCPGFD